MNDSQAYILHLTCEPSLYSYCQNRSAPFVIGVTNITEFKFSLLDILIVQFLGDFSKLPFLISNPCLFMAKYKALYSTNTYKSESYCFFMLLFVLVISFFPDPEH